MNRHTRKHGLPLMYILQPQFTPPKAKMQNKYTSQKAKDNIGEKSKKLGPKKSEEDQGLKNESEELNVIIQKEKDELLKNNLKIESQQEGNVKEVLEEETEFKQVGDGKVEREEKIGFELVTDIEMLEMTIENNIETVQEDGKVENLLDSLGDSPIIEKQKPLKKIKLFEEKNLEEKLKDLKMFPAAVVKIIYKFKTQEGIYIGYFMSQKNDVLNIVNIGNKKIHSIPLQSLIDIKMVGI